MGKYIDSEKLIAEIIQRKDWYLANADKIKNDDTDLSIFYEGRWQMCDDVIAIIDSLQQEQPDDELEKAAEEYCKEMNYLNEIRDKQKDGTLYYSLEAGTAIDAFKAGAKWQRERMENEHGKELLYVCQKTAEREHRSGVREGKAQAEKELTPLINRLCEAILFEWKDAADLARKTLTQIKAREEE